MVRRSLPAHIHTMRQARASALACLIDKTQKIIYTNCGLSWIMSPIHAKGQCAGNRIVTLDADPPPPIKAKGMILINRIVTLKKIYFSLRVFLEKQG